MTDEIDHAQPRDATAEPGVPSAIAQLGVEARAEYIRTRQRLGLGGEPAERLGTVGRYRLEAELGRGGMGIVFRASDPELDRPVAVKLVQAVPFARYDKLRTRLLREAKVLAKLTHPNVVRVYDCGQHEGEVYLAMELVEGATLRDWQRGQSQRTILDAYQQAARGLAAAHDLGITHRDFKPDNALVASDGRVLVGDFGLAGVLAGDELRTEGSPTEVSPGEQVSATRTGALLGTPTYMAPEQLRGEVATPRSDQFAFCVALWEALVGVRPFEGDRQEVLLEQIEEGRVHGAERLPRRLRTRLMRGLAADPKARFDDLRELAEGLVPRRGRVVLGVGVAASLAVGVVAGRWLEHGDEAELSPCNLPELVDDVIDLPEWSQVERTLEGPRLRPTYERLERLIGSMRVEAVNRCQPTRDPVKLARRESLEMRIKNVRVALQSSNLADPATLQNVVEDLVEESWSAPFPRGLAKRVVENLHDSYSLRRDEDTLEDALGSADEAVKAAGNRDLELAVAYRWRGRVLALLGRHDDAMASYREAIGHAQAGPYADLLLETELLAAKTAVMRQGDLDRAWDSLSRARGLLRFLGESWVSPRYANYHEILASALKRDGQFEAALSHQWYALLVRGWWDDKLDVGMGYVNLGTIYEWRGRGSDFELARLNYEQALEALDTLSSSPEWSQAAFNLGHWLVQYGGEGDWPRAQDLLENVRAKSNDAQLSALTDLVVLEIYRGNDAETALTLARELEAWLHRDGRSTKPSIPKEQRLSAWQSIASAYALAHDLAAFEDARASFDRVAQALLDDASPAQVDDLHLRTVQLDLTAASDLAETAPDRARTLATSVRDYLVRRLGEKRPSDTDNEQLPELLEDTNELLLVLDSSTTSVAHP